MNHDPADLELLIDHHQHQAEANGHPPRNLEAWRNACRKDMLENELEHPGHIENAANGLRVNARGERITRWAEVRGEYGMDWVYSPSGTATPPAGYSLVKAKAEWAARNRRLGRTG